MSSETIELARISTTTPYAEQRVGPLRRAYRVELNVRLLLVVISVDRVVTQTFVDIPTLLLDRSRKIVLS